MIYALNNASIVGITDEVETFLQGCNLDSKTVLRTRLACEEVLLKYQKALMPNNRVKLRCSKTFRRIKVELSVSGESMNPFSMRQDNQEYSDVLHAVLVSMGVAPSWQYRNGENLIVFTPQVRRRNQLAMLAIAVCLAVASGLLSILLIPQESRISFSNLLLSPLLDTFMGLLNAVSGPMIFLSIVMGICSIGDTATLGRIGRKMVSCFLGKSVLVTLAAVLIFVPFFDISGGTSGILDIQSMLGMVLDAIPGNFFTPFTKGNPLQIIFVAVVMGLSMVVLGSKVFGLQTLLEQSNYVIQLVMGAISSTVPFFVFVGIFDMILKSDFSVLGSSFKLVSMMLAGETLLIVVYVISTAARYRTEPATLIGKMIPTFLIALTTSSSAAAYQTNVECCEKKLGIDRRIIDFAVPLGQVVFMPGAIILFLSAGLCLAEAYRVTVSPALVLNAAIISFVLAVAAPPVPGGALTCYTMLVMQLGLPSEAIAIAIAFNVILEFVTTAVNVASLQLELVELAGSLGMLDRKILAGKEGKASVPDA